MAIKQDSRKVYLLFNEQNSKYRFRASRFVQDAGFVPVYETLHGDFFGLSQNPRKAKDSRNDLIRASGQVWVFGPTNATISDLVNFASSLGKGVRHFRILKDSSREVRFREVRD